jgi:hypothetical protein
VKFFVRLVVVEQVARLKEQHLLAVEQRGLLLEALLEPLTLVEVLVPLVQPQLVSEAETVVQV